MTQQWTKFMIDFSGCLPSLTGRAEYSLPGLCHLGWNSTVGGKMAEETLRLWAVSPEAQLSREDWPESQASLGR